MLLSNLDILATAPGGVARLRELILTLAVQGKLVPQDPADEPASVLLQKIRVEKDRLIAEGKIKRDKPLAEIAEEEKPFELPQGWEWVRLDAISEFANGFAFPSGQFSNDSTGVGIVKIGDIQDGEVTTNGMSYVSQEYAKTIDMSFRVAPGDMLIAMSGATTGKLGFNSTGSHFFLNQRVGKITLYFIDQQYAYSYLRTKVAENLAISAGSAIPNLSTAQIRNIVFPLPPLTEQSRIVTRVEELMRLCDALEAKGQLEAAQHAQLVSTLLGTLTASATPEDLDDNWQRVAQYFDLLLDRPEAIDALEQTLLQLAVRGLLVPQDPTDEPASALLQKIRADKDRVIATGQIKQGKPLPPITDEEKPFELPQGWEWVRFGQIASIASNLVPPALHLNKRQVAPDCIEKGTGLLLQKRTVAEAEIISPNHLFKPGQILYSKIRPSLSKAVLVDFGGLCSADMYPIESMLDSHYLLMYILSQPFLDQVSIAENRVKMPKLNQEALVTFTVPLPPLPEQSRIVTRVTALRRLCADLCQRLAERQSVQARLAEALVGQAGST